MTSTWSTILLVPLALSCGRVDFQELQDADGSDADRVDAGQNDADRRDTGMPGRRCGFGTVAPSLTMGAFVAGPALTRQRVDLVGVTLADDTAIFIGGWDGAVNVATVDRYDPGTNVITAAGDATYTRSEHAGAFVSGLDWVVVAAGDSPGPGWTAGVERYDVGGDVWSRMVPLPETRYGHAVTVDEQCQVYVMGGYCEAGALCDQVWSMDPQVGTWSPRAPVPTQRLSVSGVTASDGRIYLIGGATSAAGGYLDTMEVYLPAMDRWEPRAPMPTPRRQAAAVTLPDGTILVAGGRNGTGALATVERYDPATDMWSTEANLSVARWGAAAVVSGANVMVVGGANGTLYLDSTERAPLR